MNTNASTEPMTAITEAEISVVMGEIDLSNTNSITRFGASASEAATMVSRQMLDGVRNKDVGPVGDVMSDMILKIRGLDPTSLQGGGLFGWLKSKASRMAGFIQEFEEVSEQIEAMGDNLRSHQTKLMTSVQMMDRLYEVTVGQFHQLEVYIVAGERVLADLNTIQIPKMQKIVEGELPGEDGTPASLMPQMFSDLQNRRDQLERKIHDLKLVRMVALQSLPKIRMTQDTDNSLISKIDTITATTIPLWYSEMALALEINKTMQAAKVTTDVADATDDMLRRGADQFQQATLLARKSVERSVVGVEAVKHINDTMIKTLDGVVKITTDGRKARIEAEKSLISMETALRDALKQTAESRVGAAPKPRTLENPRSSGTTGSGTVHYVDSNVMDTVMLATVLTMPDPVAAQPTPEPAVVETNSGGFGGGHSDGGGASASWSSPSDTSYSSSSDSFSSSSFGD